MATKLRIDEIRLDGGTQSRAAIHDATVREYAEALAADTAFPPVTVFYDGTAYWLADGFHRVRAHRYAGRAEVDADVKQGTLADAQWYSLSANQKHGLRRTRADVEQAIKFALTHPEVIPTGENSNSGIGRHIGCSHNTVQKYREELEATCQIDKSDKRTGADGREINVANIGKRPAPTNTPMYPIPADDRHSVPDYNAPAFAPSHARGGGVFHPVDERPYTPAPAPWPPPYDPDTGELIEQHRDGRRFPPELLAAADRPMSPRPYTLPTMEQATADGQLEELRRALSQLLKLKDVSIEAVQRDPLMGGAVLELMRHAHGLLSVWLAAEEEAVDDPYTITV